MPIWLFTDSKASETLYFTWIEFGHVVVALKCGVVAVYQNPHEKGHDNRENG